MSEDSGVMQLAGFASAYWSAEKERFGLEEKAKKCKKQRDKAERERFELEETTEKYKRQREKAADRLCEMIRDKKKVEAESRCPDLTFCNMIFASWVKFWKKGKSAKSTARKSTGGKAPRKKLGGGLVNSGVAPTNTDVSPISKKRKTNPNVDSDNDERLLDYQTHFAKTPAETRWCRGCNDDTESAKVNCDICHHVVCYGPSGSGACLELTAEAIGSTDWTFFNCPACELLQHKTTQFIYYGFYGSDRNPMKKIIGSINNHQFTFFKPVKLQKLAIVQLQCNGANKDFEMPYRYMSLRAATYASGVVSVADVLKHRLTSPATTNLTLSQPEPLLTAHMSFDLDSPEGSAQHDSNMINLKKTVDAMAINHVVIVLVTHADPETGDLHFTADGGGAQELAVVMDALFPATIQDWLLERTVHLFMLVCGTKPLTKEGYAYMTALVARKVFDHVFLFPTAHLQPSEIALFASDLVEQVFMHYQTTERAVMLTLQNLPRLGLHTRILRLSAQTDSSGEPSAIAIRYVWTQSRCRPWGLDAPTFCVACNSVKTFDRAERKTDPNGNLAVVFRCSGPASKKAGLTPCAKDIVIPLSLCEGKLIKGPKDSRGLWQEHEFVWDASVLLRF
ncbi:hypothetical protein K435DRAFT_806482 [Dendrothele bispora CBS 962.96]|uniref:Uncharacterized protein n=1 Tax=Dendrothele bispora (strain CBS 962.96) TaxID=1314807 RepID=A0A4S8L937_DENBC|nr:hypothetical protein K435DRAFT_806482 [Dendrothele bispora CBS 962.96]